MTEYRIVATLDTQDCFTGKKRHRDVSSPWYDGHLHNETYTDRAKAEELLAYTIEECAKFDAKTQARSGRYDIRYWHTNIRIQSREVTDWAD